MNVAVYGIRDLEGSGHGLIKAMSWLVSVGTKENNGKPQSG
jgi:hypothetical protein